jgi:putative transposase
VSHRLQPAGEELGLEHECILVRTPNKNAHIEAFHWILGDECFRRYELDNFVEAYVC